MHRVDSPPVRSLATLSADLLVDYNENDPLLRLKEVKNEIGDVRGDTC